METEIVENGETTEYKFDSILDIINVIIKYKGNKQLATLLGSWFGNSLDEEEKLKSADYILPVPLHVKRLKQRGYNQSEEFARGLSEKLNIETNTTFLIRKEFTSTQTKKNKYERWENVEEVFEITDIEALKNNNRSLLSCAK